MSNIHNTRGKINFIRITQNKEINEHAYVADLYPGFPFCLTKNLEYARIFDEEDRALIDFIKKSFNDAGFEVLEIPHTNQLR